jgi:hypothetical protein
VLCARGWGRRHFGDWPLRGEYGERRPDGQQAERYSGLWLQLLQPVEPDARHRHVCIHYPSRFPVFESNWSPFGNQSGLCVGAFTPVFNGQNTRLLRCGNNPSTLWVGDLNNATTRHGRLYTPWVNGASSNFSHPLTLQVDPGTQKPINQLKLANLNTLTGGVSPDSQEFTLRFGPVNR